jgi:hypothetical protein
MYLSMRGLEVGWWGRVTMEEGGGCWNGGKGRNEGGRDGEGGGREGEKAAKDYLVIN